MASTVTDLGSLSASALLSSVQEKKEGEEEGKIEEVDEDADKKEKKKKTVRHSSGSAGRGWGSAVGQQRLAGLWDARCRTGMLCVSSAGCAAGVITSKRFQGSGCRSQSNSKASTDRQQSST